MAWEPQLLGSRLPRYVYTYSLAECRLTFVCLFPPLVKTMDDFDILKVLGKGTFGKVRVHTAYCSADWSCDSYLSPDWSGGDVQG